MQLAGDERRIIVNYREKARRAINVDPMVSLRYE